MSHPEDPYAVLGVGPNATREEIIRAFRALARHHHPDAGHGDPASFARVRGAYELLADPERRAAHDRRARGRPAGRSRRIPVRVRSAPPRRGADVGAVLAVPLRAAVHGAEPLLDLGRGRSERVRVPAGARDGQRLRVRGRGEPGRHGGAPGDLVVTLRVERDPVYRREGDDLHADLPLSYTEAVLGCTVAVTTLSGEELTVAVPAASGPGDRIRVAHGGVPASARGAAGDLVLTVRVEIPRHLDTRQRAALDRLAAVLPPPRKEPRR